MPKKIATKEQSQEKEAPLKPIVPIVGDIVQVVKRPHLHYASVWIVHSAGHGSLVGYQPGRKSSIHKINLAMDDVSVVGKARLKYNKPLPEDSTDRDLDKI